MQCLVLKHGSSEDDASVVTATLPSNESRLDSSLPKTNHDGTQKRKSLRSRPAQNDGDDELPKQTKKKSRKRNVFTEDEADEDEKRRYKNYGYYQGMT